jgi:hypothetical protein
MLRCEVLVEAAPTGAAARDPRVRRVRADLLLIEDVECRQAEV